LRPRFLLGLERYLQHRLPFRNARAAIAKQRFIEQTEQASAEVLYANTPSTFTSSLQPVLMNAVLGRGGARLRADPGAKSPFSPSPGFVLARAGLLN
jgi:hypothetical protein